MAGLLAETEARVKERIVAGDVDGATTAALRGYGQEILELLVALHRDETDASDAFALFTEGVWRGLPKFEWQSTLRTWLHAVARRCSLRQRRDRGRRAAREKALPEGSAASILVAELRTRTTSILRTEGRTKLAVLRDSLPEDDRMLLFLRVDRELGWNELAIVMHDGEDLAPKDLERESARLRKRFQLVKEKLHEMAKREGLR